MDRESPDSERLDKSVAHDTGESSWGLHEWFLSGHAGLPVSRGWVWGCPSRCWAVGMHEGLRGRCNSGVSIPSWEHSSWARSLSIQKEQPARRVGQGAQAA
jgi:hypothetical protein